MALLAFPVDLWELQHIQGALKDFTRVETWDKMASDYSRVVVKVLVADIALIPHSCMVSTGNKNQAESWSVPIIILGHNWLGALLADEESTSYACPTGGPCSPTCGAMAGVGTATAEQLVWLKSTTLLGNSW